MSRAIATVVFTPGRPGVPLNGGSAIIDAHLGQAPIKLDPAVKDGYSVTGCDDGLPLYINYLQPGFARYELHTDGVDHGDGKPFVSIPPGVNRDLVIGDAGRPLLAHEIQCPPLSGSGAGIGWTIGPSGFLYNGVPTTIKNARFYRGYQRHLDGTLDDAVLAQWKELGANMLRVFLNWGNVGFNPSTYGGRFFDQLPVFLDRLALFGLSAQLVLVAPKPESGDVDTPAKKAAFCAAVFQAVTGKRNVIFEKANEPEQTYGYQQALQYVATIPDPPAEFIWAAGSMSYFLYNKVPGHYGVFTGGRQAHHVINDCVPTEAIQATGMSWLNNESCPVEDYGFDPATAGRVGRAMKVWYGGCFDSRFQGGEAILLTDGTLACALEHFKGLE